MDTTNELKNFMDQSEKIDYKSISELLVKNANFFKKQQSEQFKRLENEIELQKKNYRKEDELRDLKDKREKELDGLEEKSYKEKKEKIKKDADKNKSEEDNSNKSKSIGLLNFLPDYIKNISSRKEDGEQKDIGEKIFRVSFHQEGIKILHTLLQPIYEALKANTETLDKKLKELIEGMSGNGGDSNFLKTLFLILPIISSIVMGFLSDVLLIATKIKDAFVWLWNLPGKIIEMFKSLEIGANFTKFVKNPLIQLGGDIKLELQGIWNATKSSLKIEGQVASFAESMNGLKNSIKTALRLEEIGVWLSTAWSENITKPLSKAGETFNTFKTSIGQWLDDIVNLFKAEGKLSGITSMFNSISSTFEGFLAYVRTFEGPLGRLLSVLKPFTAIFEFLGRILSIEFLAILDGTISAVKTLFQVWSDTDLDPFQKFTAVFLSFVGGLLDIIPNLTSLLSKGLTGALSWLTGKGWQSDNAVSDFLDKNINDQGGVGQVISKKYIGLAKSANDGTMISDTVDGAKANMGLTKPSYKNSQIYKDLSPEGQKEMDEMAERDKNAKQTPQIIQQKTEIPQNFQPVSEKINNQSNDKLEEIIKNQNQSNEKLLNALEKFSKNIQSQQQGPMVINQSSQAPKSDDSKKYLFKPIFDTNMDKRSDWWKTSREYSNSL